MNTDYTAAGRAAWLAQPLTLRRTCLILGVCVGMALLCMPLDGWVMRTLGPFGGLTERLGGDVRRELEFAQQFGAFTSILIAGLIILLQDRARAGRVTDLVAGVVLNAGACNLMKIGFGRPRPRIVFGEQSGRAPLSGYESPQHFAFFWNQYPLPRDGDSVVAGVQLTHVWAHSWEFAKGISSDLWSMPSSHAAAAACTAAALMRLYPKLTPLLVGLMVVVACARVIFGAHYPSDVLVGLGVGYVIGAWAMDGRIVSKRLWPHAV